MVKAKRKTTDQAKIIFNQYIAQSGRTYLPIDNKDKSGKEINYDTISDSKFVLKILEDIDWAFTDEDTTYLSHDIHPYPARFIPQIPRTIIKYLSFPGELVWDPFGGCGTTSLEAILNNRRSISTDINPLGEIIGRAKTTTLTMEHETDMIDFLTAIESMNSEIGNLHSYVKMHQEELEKEIPEIPNLNKWFNANAVCELSLIKHLINTQLSFDETKTIAKASLSKIINKVSNQESETKYCAIEKNIAIGQTLTIYLADLKANYEKIKGLSGILGYREAKFYTVDVMSDIVGEGKMLRENSVDLIVTSPPYPNAFDYHLYHRFRIFWLGGDPREMGKREIGSHLRHQKEKTGFNHFLDEMEMAINNFYLALKPGRYAVLVLGDAIFKGQLFHTATEIGKISEKIGFEVVGIIDRPLHETRRSMQSGVRRAKEEHLLILKKPGNLINVSLHKAPYTLWSHEDVLKKMELETLVPDAEKVGEDTINISASDLWRLKRLTFYHGYSINNAGMEPTWQSIIENGDAKNSTVTRKDPKYVTHGLHPYKGKFYPQLVKPLLNLSNTKQGGIVLDPFCGSGTVALEGLLNGYRVFGCDVNPIAVEIAKAKTEILFVDPYILERTLEGFHRKIASAPVHNKFVHVFNESIIGELNSWFPKPVIAKLGWLLTQIAEIPDIRIQRFLNVILSSIIREVSHQDPTDLRTRRRKQPLEDADVYGMFDVVLLEQKNRLLSFTKIRQYASFDFIEPTIWNGNSIEESTFSDILKPGSVDTVITSPPYATALPYIDTNRLSLLVLMRMTSKERSKIEANMTGTREISKQVRLDYESKIDANNFDEIISEKAIKLICRVLEENRSGKVGFRRQNMGALLYMYYNDMAKVFKCINKLVSEKGHIYIVIGDNITSTAKSKVRINTTEILKEYGQNLGWRLDKDIPIKVTTEDYKHINNAITRNTILCFTK